MKISVGFTLAAALAVAVLGQGQAWAATKAEIATLSGPDRQKILMEGAKKEGKVVMYTALVIDTTLRPMKEAFEKAHPGVLFEFWRGATPEIIGKAQTEARARNVFGDLLEGSSIAMPSIKGNLVEKFTSPSLAAYPKEAYDPNGLWASSRVQYNGTVFNTKLVPQGSVPQTYNDLLDPKWKGKLIWSSAAESGAFLMIATLQSAWGEKAAEEYFKKLAAQDIVNEGGGLVAASNKVGQGEFSIALHIPAQVPIQSAQKGAPTDIQLMEPVTSLINTVQLTKDAPHPHAAMLFIDWMLGKEGQAVLASTGYLPAHPEVDPEPAMRKVIPRLVGKKELFVTPEAAFNSREKSVELYKKLFN